MFFSNKQDKLPELSISNGYEPYHIKQYTTKYIM